MGDVTSETPKAVLEALARISPAAIIGLDTREHVDLVERGGFPIFLGGRRPKLPGDNYPVDSVSATIGVRHRVPSGWE